MQNDLVYNALLNYIPGSRKTTASRWISYNGPCCIHNGQMRPDTKKRSGILYDPDGRTSVFCFNCQFNASWSPGRFINDKMKNYLGWLGMPDEKFRRLNFDASLLRKHLLETGTINEVTTHTPQAKLSFESKPLPKGAMPIEMWIDEECEDENFHEVLAYLMERGDDVFESGTYYWSPETANHMNQRVIIPFYWEGEIVGWTGRIVNGSSSMRYFSDTQPHYIFNTDAIKDDWEFIFVSEGPFDGISINGVAMLGDKVTAEQIQWLNQTGKTIIVVPDRVQRGGRLVDTAVAEGWYVSFPSWGEGIKDAADAVKAFGKLYTVWSIIDSATKGKLEIEVKRQRLQ